MADLILFEGHIYQRVLYFFWVKFYGVVTVENILMQMQITNDNVSSKILQLGSITF